MIHVTGRDMTHAPFRAAYHPDDIKPLIDLVYAGRMMFHDGDVTLAPGIEFLLIGGHARGPGHPARPHRPRLGDPRLRRRCTCSRRSTRSARSPSSTISRHARGLSAHQRAGGLARSHRPRARRARDESLSGCRPRARGPGASPRQAAGVNPLSPLFSGERVRVRGRSHTIAGVGLPSPRPSPREARGEGVIRGKRHARHDHGRLPAGAELLEFRGSWRHPDSQSDFTSPDYYARIGRVLEAGKFQLAFFDDRLGMPEFHGGDFAEAVAHGIRCVKMDPIACLMPIAMSTERLGVGSTYSTTYYRALPCRAAVPDARPDDRGRAAWNVVTSMNDVEARNMGLEEVVEHDVRYDRADEFMEVVHRPLGHLGRRRADRRQDRRCASRILRRSTASATGASTSARAAPSPSRARRRAIPSSSRPDRAAAGAASPRAGAS